MSHLNASNRILQQLIGSFAYPAVGQVADAEFDLQVLEDRILYSAAPVPIDLALPIDAIDTALVNLAAIDWQPADVDFVSEAFDPMSDWPSIDEAVSADDFVAEATATWNAEPAADSLATNAELVVVDRAVDDYQQLVDDLLHAGNSRSFEIIYLDSNQSGVERLTEQLNQHTANGGIAYSAIHVVSHGTGGAFQLGSDHVSQTTIDSFADSFQQWSAALTENADVFIYGCDVASNENGRALIDSLADLTQADVAASDDLTGHASLNADWDLEYVHGVADTSIAFSASLQSNWLQQLEFNDTLASNLGQSQAMGIDGAGNVTGVSATGATASADGLDIYLYDVDASGAWINPILVNELNTNGFQHAAKIAVAENGVKVVTWTDQADLSNPIIYAKFYDASNQALGAEFQVGNNGFTVESSSAVAVDSQGNAVITWQAEVFGLRGINAQRFFADGTANGAAFSVTAGSGQQEIFESSNATVAMNDLGQFVVAWDTDKGSSDPSSRLYARVYDADGTALTDITKVAGNSSSRTFQAAVDIDEAGDFVVAYTNLSNSSNDADVRAKAFSIDAMSLGEFSFVTYDNGDQFSPDVAINDSGEVLIAWAGEGLTLEGAIDPFETWGASINLATGAIIQSQWYFEPSGPGHETINRYAPSIIDAPDGSFLTSHLTQSSGSTDTNLSTQPFTGQPIDSNRRVSGVVYEDLNGDGELSDASTVDGVNVRLFRDNGDGVRDANDVFVAQTTTAGGGQYVFEGLLITHGDYYVVVDSKTISPSATLNTANANAIWAEQSYASAGGLFETATGDATTTSAGALFSGYSGTRSDDAATLAGAEHVISVSVSAADEGLADFGFSFNVVTNTAGGGDDDAANDRGVQGSLDQFIRNANEIAGANAMRFVARSDADSHGGTVWSINVTEKLTAITDSNTIIDGTVYEATADGDALQTNNRQIGHQGFVGANSSYEFTGFVSPELEIVADATLSNADRIRYGLTVTAAGDSASISDVTIRNVSIHGFGKNSATGKNAGANIFVSGNGRALNHVDSTASNITIENNLIGLSADGATIDAGDRGHGIRIYGTNDGNIRNNYIGNHGLSGIYLQAQSFGSAASESTFWTIDGNQIVDNARQNDVLDGIGLSTSVSTSVRNNYIADNAGFGIDSYKSAGGHLIEGNTVIGNGTGGVEEGGIRLFGQNTQVLENRIAGNFGAGIVVTSFAQRSPETFTPSAGNLISRNSFEANEGLAIDLLASLLNGSTFDQLDTTNGGALNPSEVAGTTLGATDVFDRADANNNDLIGRAEFDAANIDYIGRGDGLTVTVGRENSSGNLGMDHPTILSATVYTGFIELSVELPVEADRIEVYVASDNDDNGFGEGRQYLQTIARSAMTPDGAGRFTATFSHSGTLQGSLTAIAIAADDSTSEFGNNVVTGHPPQWNRTPSERTVNSLEDTLHPFSPSFFTTGYSDADGDALAAIRIDRLPGSGELLLIDSIAMTRTQVASGAVIVASDLGKLNFEPAADAHGTETFDVSMFDGSVYSDDSYEVTIEVASINDAPTIDSLLEFSTGEDQTLVVAATDANLLSDASDVDGDPLTIVDGPTLVGQFGMLEIDQATGAFTYTPNANAAGVDVFNLQVTDGTTPVDSTLRITVGSINDAPTVTTLTDQTAEENQTFVVTLAGDDIEGGTLSYKIVGGDDSDLFAIDNDTNELKFIASPDFETRADQNSDGIYEVRVVAIDDDGLQSESPTAVYVTIKDVNDAPYWVTRKPTTSVTGDGETLDGLLNLYDTVVDVDAGDQLALSVVRQPKYGEVSIQPDGKFTYTRLADSPNGKDSFQFQATDLSGAASGNVTVKLILSSIPATTGGEDNGDDTEEERPSSDTLVIDLVPNTNEEENENEDEEGKNGPSTELGSSLFNATGAGISDLGGDSGSETDPLREDLLFDGEGKTYGYALRLESLNVFSRLVSADQPVRTIAAIDFDLDVLATAFLQELGASKDKYLYADAEIGTSEIAASAATLLTMSYVIWNMGSGILLSSFMSSLPAWSSFDVLPVIANAKYQLEDDESIEQIVDA